MIDHKKNQPDDKKVGISPMAVAVTGAVVGIGLAVAGAVVLSDEKNREKVKDAFTDAKKHTQEYVSDMQHRVENKKVEVENKAAKLVAVVEEAAKEVKKI